MSALAAFRISALGIAAVLLASCGGGGNSSTVAPSGIVATATPAAPAGAGSLSFAILVPGSSGAGSTARAPQFVSPATASMSVALQGASAPLATVNLGSSSPNCTSAVGGLKCTVTVSAPAGSNTFLVATYDGANGTGRQLSSTPVVASVSANSTNVVPLALNGVVTSAAVILGSTGLPAGVPGSVSVSIVAYDASNNVIVGPGNFSTPVTLADSDASGVTSLSATSVGAPGTSVTLAYNGNSLTGATITPSISGTPGTPATFAPVGSAVVNYALPSNAYYIGQLTAGPDGNVWYATQYDDVNPPAIGKVGMHGQVTSYSAGLPLSNVFALTAGPDGAMWFGTNSGTIGRIDMAGNVTLPVTASTPCGSPINACGAVFQIVSGPDGNLWFTDNSGYVGVVNLGTMTMTEYLIHAIPGYPMSNVANPYHLLFGPDGKLYVGDANGVDQITLAAGAPASVVQMPAPAGANCFIDGMTIGADGNLWFADDCVNINMVPFAGFATPGAIIGWSTNGVTGGTGLQRLISSPGGMWGTNNRDASVYRIFGIGGVSASLGPAIAPVRAFGFTGASAYAIALGPDGNIWVAEDNNTPVALAKIIYGAPGPGGAAGALAAQRLPGTLSRTPSDSSRRPFGRRSR